MRIGIMHVPYHATDDAIVVATKAEELGFESYWMGEHVIVPPESPFPYPDNCVSMPDPVVTLAAVAGATNRITIGTSVVLAAEHHPIRLAKQLATLDRISDGRLIVGIGGGWNEAQSTTMGGDFPRRWSQIREYVAAMKELWTNDPASFHGNYVSFDSIRCLPQPLQRPHPRIYLGGSPENPRIVGRVVGWADGWMPAIEDQADLQKVASVIKDIKSAAVEAGRDAATIEFTLAGLEGQWTSAEDIERIAEAGCERVSLWLPYAGPEVAIPVLERWAELL